MQANEDRCGPPPPRIRYSFLKILTGSDLSRRRLPLMAADSGRRGPAVWLTACGHGDEVGGIVIIQDIFKRLRKTPLLRGALYAFPLMNPIGFETSSRQITLSKEDLNRSFPGNPSGSLGERIAEKIFTTIIETRPSLVLDLHNDWIKSIPYTVVDAPPGADRKAVHAKAKVFGEKIGFVTVGDPQALKTTLSYCLIQRGIPALTLELGESYTVNERIIAYGVQSIWNLLADLGMTRAMGDAAGYPVPQAYRGKVLRYSDRPFSSTSGIIRFLVKAGDLVRAGQPVARTYNAFGRLQETLFVREEGIVLGHTDSSVVFPGVRVLAFGNP